MHIDYVELVGYTRIGLGDIRSFTMRPTAAMQFVLGTNGYGKSSLVSSFSPLPAEKDHFTSDGRQVIHGTYRGNSYQLISDFSKEHVHQFIRNGVNLNDGGTITVQRDLVKYHFNYDAARHRFIQGIRKFSDMTPAERKDLFTDMNLAKFEYTLSVYHKAMKLLSQMTGAREMHKKRLVIETAKVITKQEHAVLEKQCQDLYDVVTAMIEKRSPDVKDQAQLEAQFAKLVEYSKSRIAALVAQFRKADRARLRSVDSLIQARDEVRTEITRCKTLSEHFLAEFEKVDDLFKAYERAKVDSLAGIDKSIRDNEQIIIQAKASISIGIEEGTSAQTIIDSCDSILNVWSEHVELLHDNSEHNYNRTTFGEVSEVLAQLSVKKHSLLERKARCEQMLEHQMLHANSDDIECPKCTHVFKLGFDATTTANLKSQLNETIQEIEKVSACVAEAEAKRDAMRAYFQAYTAALNLFRNAPGLTLLVDYINRNTLLANNPSSIPTLVRSYRGEAGAFMRIQQAMAAIEAAQELQNRTLSDDVTSGDVVTKRSQLEKEVAVNEQAVQRLVNQEKDITTGIKLLETIEQQRQELKELQQKVLTSEDDLIENFRKMTFNNTLRDLNSELAKKELALRASERQLAVIDHITEEITSLTEQIGDMTLLVKELSPKEGLIAEGIFTFMKRFVADVNATIRKTWSYPLVVKPCAVEKGDSLVLNYRFPLVVKHDPKPRKDVSEGSEGMIDLVNLAFRIAGMKALGLGDFPLILDEYGRTFDAKHKNSSVHMIGNLLDTANFTQIFMISHDIAQYGSIERAEVCVLDEKNIVLPPGCVYNKHVQIT